MRALDKVQIHLGPHLNRSRQSVNDIVQQNKESDDRLHQINLALEHIPDDTQTGPLESAKTTADKSNQRAQKALKIMNPIVKSLAEDTKRAKDLPVEMDKTSKDIAQIRKQVDDVTKVMPNIQNLVENLETRQNTTNLKVSGLGDKLQKLRSQVDNAREIANSINLGVAFHPNTTLELKTPENLQLLATNSRFSTFFRTEKPNGFVVYLGNEEKPNDDGKPKQQDFMALEIENGYPVLSVDLGYGPERVVSDKFVADGEWRQAIVDRVGNNIQLTIREELDNGMEKLHQANHTIPGPYSVFNVDQDSRLFVGGYPPDFNIQNGVKYSSFEGEIEELKIGDDHIGLWNFVDGQSNSNGARERNKLYSSEKPSTGYRFNGNGYAMVDAKAFSFTTRSNIQFKFKATRDAGDGLMFYVGKNRHFMSIEMRDGAVVYQFKLGQHLVNFRTPKTYNDDQWHDLVAVRDGSRGKLVVDGEDMYAEESTGKEPLKVSEVMYFGGHPGRINHSEVTNQGFDGCIDSVFIEGTPVDLTRNLKALGTRRGCPVKLSTSVTFQPHKYGYVKQGNVSADNHLQVYLRFRTKHEDGVLFFATNNDQSATMGLALFEGKLHLTSNGVTTVSKRLNDGEWHTVTATHDSRSLRLSIDDSAHYEEPLGQSYLQIQHGEIFFGGLPRNYRMASHAMQTSAYFVGCISDANVNNGGVNFAETRDKHNAVLDNCPVDMFEYELWKVPNYYPEQEVDSDINTRFNVPDDKMNEIEDKEDREEEKEKPTPKPKPKPKPKTTTTTTTMKPWPTQPQQEQKTGCQLGRDKFDWDLDYDMSIGYRFGLKKDSRVEIYDALPAKRPVHYYLEFKTTETDGILFYASGARHTDYMALFMENGKLVFQFRGGANMANLTSNFMYHNGDWHTVSFSRLQDEARMVVDGDDETNVDSSMITKIKLQNPLYVGGIPETDLEDTHINLNTPKGSYFQGCIRGMTINNKVPVDPKAIDVAPCSSQVEAGTFFSGGYVKLREKLRVGTDIRISMQIKARTQNGLLMSVHGKKALLIIQLLNGTVSFVVDNGDRIFETVFVPENKNLCDGEWHSIVAIKTKFVITLQVDGVQSQPTIGPAKSPSAETSRALFMGGHQHLGRIRGLKAREPYHGCIRDVKIDDKPERVSNHMVTGDVLVGVCPTF